MLVVAALSYSTNTVSLNIVMPYVTIPAKRLVIGARFAASLKREPTTHGRDTLATASNVVVVVDAKRETQTKACGIPQERGARCRLSAAALVY